MILHYDQATKLAGKGAKWLDRHVPDWADRISLKELNLMATDSCVLGQVLGDFTEGLNRLQAEGIIKVKWTFQFCSWSCSTSGSRWTYRYGFNLPERYDYHLSWERLTSAWKDEVHARRPERFRGVIRDRSNLVLVP